MDAAATGVTEKEDREQGIDQQDIFYCMVFFLAALTRGLFSRVLGADNASFRPVMGKRGESSWLPVHTAPILTQQMDERMARLLTPALQDQLSSRTQTPPVETIEEHGKEAASLPNAA